MEKSYVKFIPNIELRKAISYLTSYVSFRMSIMQILDKIIWYN